MLMSESEKKKIVLEKNKTWCDLQKKMLVTHDLVNTRVEISLD